MTQRRCGTCRYFEEGGLAGSGWCRHPQRRDLQQMVFVRRGELACRTGWDGDLWEPRDTEQRPVLAVVSGSWARHSDGSSTAHDPPPSAALEDELPPFSPPRTAIPSLDHLPSVDERLDREGQSGETEPFPSVAVSETWSEPSSATRSDEVLPEDVPPDAPALLASLPRLCRTCRDFRPLGDGRMGWCNNSFAFPERTMVHAETLACAGTIGSWWLPSDEWWLRQADISHHGQPTPHVDAFLRQLLRERQQERRRRASS